MARSSLGIVIPALNEEETIGRIIIKLKKFGDVFVINDCSTDQTKNISLKLGATVLTNKIKCGYEGSILKGLNFLLKKKYKFLATFDADGELDCKFFNNYKNEKFDILVGSRNKYNRISEEIFSLTSKFFFQIPDMLCGARIYRSDFLKKIIPKVKENNLNTYILLLAKKNRGEIAQKKIKTFKRKGVSRFGNGILANLYIIKVMIKIIYFKLIS